MVSRESDHGCLVAQNATGIDDDLRGLPEAIRVVAAKVDQCLRRIFGNDDVEIGRMYQECHIGQKPIVPTFCGENCDDVIVDR